VTATNPQPTGKLAYTGYDLESQLTIAWTLLMAGGAALILGRRRA
jgi:LPXTG-motif cell wall-anchored protein